MEYAEHMSNDKQMEDLSSALTFLERADENLQLAAMRLLNVPGLGKENDKLWGLFLESRFLLHRLRWTGKVLSRRSQCAV